jgi:hypothetical protein
LPYIFVANYNDLTFGDGVTCVRGTYLDGETTKTALYDPLIYAGYYLGAADTVADASSDKDCRINVNGGSWNMIRGGNHRTATTSPIGVYSGNIVIRVAENAKLTSKSATASAAYVTAASGMNYLTGNATLVLDNVDVMGPVYGISRHGTTNASTPGVGLANGYSGSVTVVVNDSRIATGIANTANVGIQATQEIDPTLFTGDYTLVLLNSTVNTKVVSGNSENNLSTLKLLGNLGYTPTSFDNTVAIPYGDVNLNGIANSLDLVIMKRMLAGWSGYEDYALSAITDLNSDGRINSIDAVILARHLAGWSDYSALPIK